MSGIRTEVELQRLERVLGPDTRTVKALACLSPQDLRVLTDAVSDHLLEAGRPGFQTMVALADRLPGAVSASLAERVLGPELGARAAALLSARRAVDLAGRVSAEFLTDVAVLIDARHVSELIAHIPTPTIEEVARRLGEREEWIAMGSLVNHVSAPGLEAALAVLGDEDILRVAPFVDGGVIDRVVGLLPDARLASMAALTRHEALLEDILARVGGKGRARILAVAPAAPGG